MSHIDWLTIVGRRSVDEVDWSVTDAYRTAVTCLADTSTSFMDAFGDPLRYSIVKPRAPYSFARRSEDASRTLYVHPLSAHFTFEASGTACQAARDYIPKILADFEGKFSRIDLAVDMECDVTPLEFDSHITEGRIKTRSRMSSSTGQTVYIGSRSSERFARVYRYFAPHPRSGLLRAEFQLKGDYANALAHQVACGASLAAIARAQGEHFGFAHPCWNVDAAPEALRVNSHAQSGNTVHWLTTTVAPLLRRMQREGKLDVEAWLDEYVRNA